MSFFASASKLDCPSVLTNKFRSYRDTNNNSNNISNNDINIILYIQVWLFTCLPQIIFFLSCSGLYEAKAIVCWNRRLIPWTCVYPEKQKLCSSTSSPSAAPLNIIRSCWQGFNKWYLKLSHVTSLSKGLTRVGVVHFPIRVRMLSWEWINGLPFSVLVTIFFFFSQRMSYQNFNVLYNLWIISLCSTALTFSTYSNLIE